MTIPPDSTGVIHQTHDFIRQLFIRTTTLMDEIRVYRGQPPLIYALWEHEGITQSELAERLYLSSATVTRMVQRMELTGLIERRPDPNDQRISRVYLTVKGREIRSAVAQRDQQVGEEMLAGFSAAERAQVAEFLVRMQQNLLKTNSEIHPDPHDPHQTSA